jgi:hypothetical protein
MVTTTSESIRLPAGLERIWDEIDALP